jgi:hypothetical protein
MNVYARPVREEVFILISQPLILHVTSSEENSSGQKYLKTVPLVTKIGALYVNILCSASE